MITESIALLDANKTTAGLHLVSGAADFQKAFESNPTATPAAYVFMLKETPSPGRFSGDGIQLISLSMAVVLVLRNVADPRGQAVQADLITLRNAVKSLLLEWVPITHYAPLERGPSQLMAFKDGHMWWQDAYNSSYYERKS